MLGHAINTVKEEVALAERDLHALTAWLDARHVAGDPELFADGVARIRRLAQRRRARLVDDLRAAAEVRRQKFGLVAEMLEPNVKDGSGGLRDAQSLSWAGWTLGEPGGWHAARRAGLPPRRRSRTPGRRDRAAARRSRRPASGHGQPVRRADAPGAGCGRRRDGRGGRRRARARPGGRGACHRVARDGRLRPARGHRARARWTCLAARPRPRRGRRRARRANRVLRRRRRRRDARAAGGRRRGRAGRVVRAGIARAFEGDRPRRVGRRGPGCLRVSSCAPGAARCRCSRRWTRPAR